MRRSSLQFESRHRLRAEARFAKRALVGGVAAVLLLAPAASRAQSDVAPPLPNVLILLDTSGSMERKANATLPAGAPWTTSAEKTRWIQALEVLGGSIDNFKLLHEPRTGGDFVNEFGLGGQNPYDLDYYLPHFRPLSNNCAIGSTSLSTTKTWPTDWKTWGTSSFGFRTWGGASLGTIGSCSPTDFRTDGLGILDTFRDQARFGLMTFDTQPDPKTGWTGSAHVPTDGMTGAWSYYPGWDGTGTSSPVYGWPAGCTIDPGTLSTHLHELGARNPSAPPWEGPLVPFADDDSTTALRTVNDRIRYAMLAARPYGATPLAPMLADAEHYLWDDPKGAKIDPYGTCRGNFIILITDGFPNSDLRPNCENSSDPKAASTWPGCDTTTGGGGCCPTKRPQDITYDLYHPTGGKPPVKTFVVGFSLSDDMGAPVDCSTIDPKSGACASSTLDPKFKPCCTLHEMAFNGGSDRALLASDTDTLRAALVKAMSEATATTSTSRTVPVFASASASSGGAGQYEFRSSFKVNAFGPWTGVLERIRWECKSAAGIVAATPVPLETAKGDDYMVNLTKMAARNFYTWDATASGAKSGDTMRPNLMASDSDGMAFYAPPNQINASGSAFVGGVSPAMMNITAACADTTTPDECRTKLMNYALGLPQPKPTWMSRVAIPLGDIYHATPVQVGPPSAFLRDESYSAFRNKPGVSNRTPFALTATNDGLLHAFKTNVTSDSDPEAEIYAIIPPAVLPHIGKQYGGAHALLLDAAPVVKDVAFGLTTSTRPWGRNSTDARGGNGNWRTIAVGGLTTGRGYYALDVTEPKNPKLLWQLTKWHQTGAFAAPVAQDLFGAVPGAPAIGTVYLDDAGTKVETPVAFLPGGEGTQFAPGQCNRYPRLTPPPSDPTTTPRGRVRCWTGPGNSFTVVRLYDGKILRTFRNDPTPSDGVHPPETGSATQLIESAGKAPNIILDDTGQWPTIDSPITGAVALFPGGTGTVTTRAFVGDYDGTMWKVDVSDPKPEKWSFSIFHDPYFPSDTTNLDHTTWGPSALPPVLSVDRFGDIVVDYATGDQNNFSIKNLNHIYSITERTSVGATGVRTLTPKLNWHIKLTAGNTPTGPLSLFGGNLFFSTFTPDVSSADACLKGQGTLWGVDYLETEPSVTNDDLTPVPMGRHKRIGAETVTGTCPPAIPNSDARTTTHPFFRCIQLPPGSIVFGAGIVQRPSCVTEPSSAIGIDPYTGASSAHTPIAAINPGEFQLVAQTGPKASSAGGGSVTNTYTRTLTPPLSTTRIDSWAAIIE